MEKTYKFTRQELDDIWLALFYATGETEEDKANIRTARAIVQKVVRDQSND